MNLKNPKDLFIGIVAVASTTLSAWLFLSHYFWPRDDLLTRFLMSESKRHGEITVHYLKESQERELTNAEKWRLDLAEREQKRIHDILMGDKN